MKNTLTFEALGTRWHIGADMQKISLLESAIKDTVSRFEKNYSRFNPQSAVSKLNTQRYVKNPSSEFIDMLNFALDFYTATNGYFDISIGGELVANGYGKGTGTERSARLSNDLEITDTSIRLAGDAMLDFGGFGKGWLIDVIADFLRAQNMHDFIINAGGDIFVCGNEDIAISDPHNPKQYIGMLNMQQSALCTSSNLVRRWTHNNQTHLHIPDANTAIASTHVLHPKAAIADALATSLLIMDDDQAKAVCQTFNAAYMRTYSDGATIYRSSDFNFIKN